MATADQLKQGGNAAKLGAMSPPPVARGFTPASGNSSTPKPSAARPHPVGKITGKGTGTSDQVPINASNGEFIIKAAAVKIIGLETLEALNAVADGPDEKDSKAEAEAEYGDTEGEAEDKGEGPESAEGMKCGGKVKGMATGGLIDEQKKNSFGDAASRIPAGAGTFPAPAPDGKDSTELGRNIGNTLSALPGAAPMLGGIRALAGASKVGNALDAVGGTAGAVAAKVAPYAAPVVGFGAIASASRPEVPVSSVLTPQPPSKAPTPQTTTANPATAQAMPGQAPPVGMPGQVTKTMQPNGVTSYSGENVSGDINLAGNRGGVISAQNNQAAENLARAGGQTRGFGPAGAIRGGGQVSSTDTSAGYAADLKQLAGIDAAKAEQNANMQAQADYAQNFALQQRGFGGSRAALQMLAQNKNNAVTKRGQDMQARDARDSNKLAQENQKLAVAKDGREATAAGFTSRSAGRIEALQASYEAAKPEDRAAIAEQLRVMTGKDKPSQWKALALQGATDSMGNQTEGVLAAVNEQTGEVKRLDHGQGAAPAAAPKPGEARNGYKFKGGNPADQTNWEKI